MIEGTNAIKNGHHPFKRLDQNGNGGFDFGELLAGFDKTGKGEKLLKSFDRVDKDGNGELSQAELKLFRSHVRQNIFDEIDKNGSGGLDKGEIQTLMDRTGLGASLLANFSTIDANGDGEVTPDELQSYRANQKAG